MTEQIISQSRSESNSRFILTAAPADAEAVEAILQGVPFACVGAVDGTNQLCLSAEDASIEMPLAELLANYKETLAGI